VADVFLRLWLRSWRSLDRGPRPRPARRGERSPSYRPVVEALEERLPPGDAAGALFGGLLARPAPGLTPALSPPDGSSSGLDQGSGAGSDAGAGSGQPAAAAGGASSTSAGAADPGGSPSGNGGLSSPPTAAPTGPNLPLILPGGGAMPPGVVPGFSPVLPGFNPFTLAVGHPHHPAPHLPLTSHPHHGHGRPRPRHGHPAPNTTAPATTAPATPVPAAGSPASAGTTTGPQADPGTTASAPDQGTVASVPDTKPSPGDSAEGVGITLAAGSPGVGSGGSSGGQGGTGAGGAAGSGAGCTCGSGTSQGAGSPAGKQLVNVGGTVGPVVNISQSAGSVGGTEQAEEAITVDPAHPGHLFMEANNFASSGTFPLMGVYIAQSSDNGATWFNGRQIATGNDSFRTTLGDPSVAFDKYGNLFMTYVDENGGPGDGVDIYLSTDEGTTFSLLATVPNNTVGQLSDQPTVVTGPNTDGVHGSFWVSFTDAATNSQFAFGAPTLGLGQVGAISRLFRVSNTSGNFGDIAVGPKGQVMVAYDDELSRTMASSISVAVKTDGFGPGAFSAPVKATDTNVGFFTPIIAQPGRTIDSEAGLAWDRSGGPHSGRVYLMYTDAPSVAQNTTITDVKVRFSDDMGATWSAPVTVNDTTGHLSFLPKIALDQTTGQIGVSWYDTRNDKGQGVPNDHDGKANNEPEIYMAFSSSGGRCFSQNIQVSHVASSAIVNPDGPPGAPSLAQFDFGDYSAAAFDRGVFHPAWADNSTNLPVFGIATAAITPPRLQANQDTFDPDETSDTAHNFGVLPAGQAVALDNLTISTLPNGLPDYDWFRWKMPASGTFQVNFNVVETSGDLELHIFTVDSNNTLHELANISTVNAATCNSTQPLAVAVHGGEPIFVEVKGANSALGVHDVGLYNLTVAVS
jgi:hypothetical protein